MARFDNAIAVADRLITKDGEKSKLRRTTAGTTPDPLVPFERDDPVITNTDVDAVWLSYKDGRVDGTLIRMGDQQVLMRGESQLGTIEPNNITDSMVRASGEVWNIVEVKPLSPNGQKIIYTAQVRK